MSRFTALLSQVGKASGSTPSRLAIDFGSSRTRVRLGSKLLFDQPSCVAIHNTSGAILAIGNAAYSMLGKGVEQVQVLFPVQRGKVAHLAAAQAFFEVVLRPFLPSFRLLQPLLLREVVLAVPASSTAAQRSFYRQALATTGYFHLTYQTKAAALARVVQAHKPQLLIDIGGQTTEVVICQEKEVLIKKTIPLGGDDFTRVMIQSIRATHLCEVGWQTGEEIKAEIGKIALKKNSAAAELLTVVRGKDVVSNLPKTIQVKNTELSKELTQVANELLLQVREVCDVAPAELLAQALEEGIYFTGGGSLLKNLTDFLAEGMNTHALCSAHPQLDVIRGLPT
jgi:rod shape-determining protein MreB